MPQATGKYLTNSRLYEACRAIEQGWDDMVKDCPSQDALCKRASRITGERIDSKRLRKILGMIGKTSPTKEGGRGLWTKRLIALGREIQSLAEQGGLELSDEFKELFK